VARARQRSARASRAAYECGIRPAVRILPPCAALLCLAFASHARAYEDQLTLGLGAGYAHAAASGLPRSGAAVELSASAGLAPAWSVRTRAAYALHPGDRALHVALLDGELLYLIDVLQLVPYFGAGAGGIARAGAIEFDVDASAHLVLGLDYLVSRAVTLELEARPYLILTELARDPFYLTITAGVVFMFDA
jgi:hypothetical protein